MTVHQRKWRPTYCKRAGPNMRVIEEVSVELSWRLKQLGRKEAPPISSPYGISSPLLVMFASAAGIYNKELAQGEAMVFHFPMQSVAQAI